MKKMLRLSATVAAVALAPSLGIAGGTQSTAAHVPGADSGMPSQTYEGRSAHVPFNVRHGGRILRPDVEWYVPPTTNVTIGVPVGIVPRGR